MKEDELTKLLLKSINDMPKCFEDICREMNIVGDLGGMQGFIYNELVTLDNQGKITYNPDTYKYSILIQLYNSNK